MRSKMATDAGRQALQVRKQSVEPVFGVMKSVLGLRRFLLRGLAGARAEFRIAALAVNLRKLVACGPPRGLRRELTSEKPPRVLPGRPEAGHRPHTVATRGHPTQPLRQPATRALRPPLPNTIGPSSP